MAFSNRPISGAPIAGDSGVIEFKTFRIDLKTYLPAYMKNSDSMNEFCDAVSESMSGVADQIDDFKYFSDFEVLLDDKLELLSQQFGLDYPKALSKEIKQVMVRDAIDIWKANGTERAMKRLFQFLGWTVSFKYYWGLRENSLAPYTVTDGVASVILNDRETPIEGIENVYSDGTYVDLKDSLGNTYPKYKIYGENYLDGTVGEFSKLPYVKIAIPRDDYETFTQDFSDSDGTYTFDQSENYAIFTAIVEHFTELARPANVTVLEISVDNNIVDTFKFFTNDDGTIINGVRSGTKLETIIFNSTATDYGCRDIVYAADQDLHVMIGNGYRISYSNDGGLSWTQATNGVPSQANGNLWSITYRNNPDLFVIVGDVNGDGMAQILTSPDGENWTKQTNSINERLKNIYWSESESLFVATGEDYNAGHNKALAAYSSDGITWTVGTPDASIQINTHFNDAAYSEGSTVVDIHVGVGDVGTNALLTSTDGINWTNQGNPFVSRKGGSDNTLTAVCWSEYHQMFVGCGNETDDGNAVIYTSTDGLVWTETTSHPQTDTNFNYVFLADIFAGDQYFMIAGDPQADSGHPDYQKAILWFSADGFNWTQVPGVPADNIGMDGVSYDSNEKAFLIGRWHNGTQSEIFRYTTVPIQEEYNFVINQDNTILQNLATDNGGDQTFGHDTDGGYFVDRFVWGEQFGDYDGLYDYTVNRSDQGPLAAQTITRQYPAGTSGKQVYVPVTRNTHIDVSVPADASMKIFTSGSPTTDDRRAIASDWESSIYTKWTETHEVSAKLNQLIQIDDAFNVMFDVTTPSGSSAIDITLLTNTTAAEDAGTDQFLSTTAFNPADKAASIALSNNNLTLTGTTTSVHCVRAVSPLTGKSYWEFTQENFAGSDESWCGISNTNFSLTDGLGFDGAGNSYGARPSTADSLYRVYFQGNNTNKAQSFTRPITTMIAFDAITRKLWFGADGEWHGGGDPTLGTSPTYSGVAAGDWYPTATAKNTTSGVANFGGVPSAPFAFPVPSGFVAGVVA